MTLNQTYEPIDLDPAELCLRAWILIQQEFNPQILDTGFVRRIWGVAFRAGVIEGAMNVDTRDRE